MVGKAPIFSLNGSHGDFRKPRLQRQLPLGRNYNIQAGGRDHGAEADAPTLEFSRVASGKSCGGRGKDYVAPVRERLIAVGLMECLSPSRELRFESHELPGPVERENVGPA